MRASGITFQTKRKCRYGLHEWTAILLEMCGKCTTAESAARDLGATGKMPTGK